MCEYLYSNGEMMINLSPFFRISAPSVGSVCRIWASVEIPIFKEVRTHVLLRLAIPHDLRRAHCDQNEESCSRQAGSAADLLGLPNMMLPGRMLDIPQEV